MGPSQSLTKGVRVQIGGWASGVAERPPSATWLGANPVLVGIQLKGIQSCHASFWSRSFWTMAACVQFSCVIDAAAVVVLGYSVYVVVWVHWHCKGGMTFVVWPHYERRPELGTDHSDCGAAAWAVIKFENIQIQPSFL
jgi:hypothetical protein